MQSTPPNKLADAMYQAFDNRGVEKMLRERLNKNILDSIPSWQLMEFVANTAEIEGWQEDLIRAALLEQPDSPAMTRVAVYDPINEAIEKNKKTTGTAGEVARVASSLVKVLNQASPSDLRPEVFTALYKDLKDLYSEYSKLSEGVTAK